MPANRLGIHAGVWGLDSSTTAVERAIEGAWQASFELIEIPAANRSDVDVVVVRRSLERYGIEPVVSLALTFPQDINTMEAASSARGERRLLEAVGFASRIGASLVTGVTFSAMGRYGRISSTAERSNSLAVLRRVANQARRQGIRIGVEYVNRYESNLLNTVAQTVQYLTDLDVDNSLLHLDTFHAHVEEGDVGMSITAAGNRLGYVHASESHRGPLGTGAIDWARVARAVHAAQYTGPITVETFSPAVLTEAQSVELAAWRTLWSDPTDLAAGAHEYLRAQLDAAAISSTVCTPN